MGQLMEHWELKHVWWKEDLEFELQQRNDIASLLRKHTDDKMGDSFREMIRSIDNRIKFLKKEYKKIYGVNLRNDNGRP